MTTAAPRYPRWFLEAIAPHGYSPLPNEMVLDFARKQASADALKVTLFILRWSLGEGKLQAELTDDEFIHGKIMPPDSVDRGLDTIPESFLAHLPPYTPLPHQVLYLLLKLDTRAGMLLGLYMARWTWGESKQHETFALADLHAFARAGNVSDQEVAKGLKELQRLGLAKESGAHRWAIQLRLDYDWRR